MSWPDAYQGPLGLQSALATAQPGDELWLAQGTYVPTDDGDRQVSFVLDTDITLLGGFAGNESAPDQRSPGTNVTVLSGDLLGNDGPNFSNRSDNSFHVIFLVGTNDTIDGFTIRGGNASGLGEG